MKTKSLFIAVLFCAVNFSTAMAQTAPSFAAAQSFAVLGSSTITNTGGTIVTGNMGVSAGTAITGFLPGTLSGLKYSGAPSIAGPAQASATDVYLNLKAQTSLTTTNLTGKVLGETAGAITLSPGIYTFSSSAQLNATLTLDDSSNPNAVFIFQIGSTLTTASYAKVVMKSGGKGKNVFWQIGSSATIGTYTNFTGNILALASITMTTGATTTGKLFALTAAVTMDSNIVEGGDLTGAPQIVDADGDGVADNLDDYPNDATKAFNNYSTKGAGATVAFEDQWPAKGDFDMNDVVVLQKYNVITNAKNVVVQVIGYYTLLATGGNYGNGFSVQFPIPTASVSGLTGGTLEAGQDKAVVVLFTNMRSETSAWNTVPGATQGASKTYNITFNVANGPTLSAFGTDYNPFIVNMVGTSRREVHLAGKTPTILADQTVFGTLDDNTNIAAGRYYVTKTGLPYAISVPTTFNYPIEGTDISKAFTHFAEWATSGGVNYIDWYSNTAADYRNPSLIYSK
ncbi:LruC domain-containing protein [Mucilaginibacter gracilis]|uniref:LruC domain-containing protein n=1 Tax=Mucilaginibacter gracilis TaxID=423350 RepID=A0A495J0K9_9SPHI|nr:LruC domain-containing protein [Mucilaginibacter gracilis]RKR81629.1 LruC domain-containing protein [Mucilaginibacter gracilis]